MKKSAKPDPPAERPALYISKRVRGKYANLLKQGTNVIILDPTLLPYFPDSESVNRALHAFLAIDEQVKSASTRARTRRRPAPPTSSSYDPRVGTETASASR